MSLELRAGALGNRVPHTLTWSSCRGAVPWCPAPSVPVSAARMVAPTEASFFFFFFFKDNFLLALNLPV